MFKYKLVFILSLCFSLTCFAADEKTEPAKDATNSIEYIDNIYNNWLRNVAIPDLKKYCQENNYDLKLPYCTDKSLFYGDGVVGTSPKDSMWVIKRQAAFQAALSQAHAKVAEFLTVYYQTKIRQTLIRDNEDPEFEENDKSSNSVLLDKAIAVVDGTLDQKLRELNVDLEKFQKASNSIKKTMLEDAIAMESAKHALEDLTGVIPYQTFEGYDIFGNHVIRVVVSVDPNRTALIKSMFANQGNQPSYSCKHSQQKLIDLLTLDEETLFQQFGTRLLCDENDQYVLVSFGQSLVENTTSKAEQGASLRTARINASAAAESNIQTLLKSQTSRQNMVSEMVKYLKQKKLIKNEQTGEIIEELSKEDIYINKINDEILTSANGHLAGMKEFRPWKYIHPQFNHKIYGTVVTWSPQLAYQSRQLKKIHEQQPQNTIEEETSSQPFLQKVIIGIPSDF